jgi:HD-GYP domain-containing protein (c-di-GMP phosphodiesterase class II)
MPDRRLLQRNGNSRRNGHSEDGHAQAMILRALREWQPALSDHSEGVARLAEAVGERLRLEPDAQRELVQAAELHDVGKIAIPERILGKDGPLDDEEWALIRRHTVIGERIVASAPSLEGVARIVRSSHERWDGGGYPDGLAGEQIPLASRIVFACDAFHVMTSERPYAPPMSRGEAIAELRRCSGGQFDPEIADSLIAVVTSGAISSQRPLRVAPLTRLNGATVPARS